MPTANGPCLYAMEVACLHTGVAAVGVVLGFNGGRVSLPGSHLHGFQKRAVALSSWDVLEVARGLEVAGDSFHLSHPKGCPKFWTACVFVTIGPTKDTMRPGSPTFGKKGPQLAVHQSGCRLPVRSDSLNDQPELLLQNFSPLTWKQTKGLFKRTHRQVATRSPRGRLFGYSLPNHGSVKRGTIGLPIHADHPRSTIGSVQRGPPIDPSRRLATASGVSHTLRARR